MQTKHIGLYNKSTTIQRLKEPTADGLQHVGSYWTSHRFVPNSKSLIGHFKWTAIARATLWLPVWHSVICQCNYLPGFCPLGPDDQWQVQVEPIGCLRSFSPHADLYPIPLQITISWFCACLVSQLRAFIFPCYLMSWRKFGIWLASSLPKFVCRITARFILIWAQGICYQLPAHYFLFYG